MASPFLGEIRIFAGNFAPNGWALCNGQPMQISQYTGLYALLGLQFGGTNTSFNLPDYRGCIPVGQGINLSNYVVGQTGGENSHALTTSEMLAHTHPFNADGGAANQGTSTNNMYGNGGRNNRIYADASNSTYYADNSVNQAGGNQGHENRQPYLTLNYIIALFGVFPARP